jgi:hypothetical protein
MEAQVYLEPQFAAIGQGDSFGDQAIWLNLQANVPPFGVELSMAARNNAQDPAD